jgi:AcrR family transcriptional regulator
MAARTGTAAAREEERLMSVLPHSEPLPPHKARRHDRILAAAIELTTEGGSYESIQIRDVAERAGVALATLYRYFPSKEVLYAAALVQWSQDYFRRSPHNEASTDEERLRKFYKSTVRSIERWPQMVRAALVLASSNDPSVRALLEENNRLYSQGTHTAIRDLSDSDREDAILVLDAVYTNATRNWATGRSSIRDVERDVLRALDLVFRAVKPAQ